MKIGDKILELRKNTKMSQEKLAEKLNVTRQTISNWELGQTLPDIEQTKEISKIFNITLDELVDNDVKDVLVEKVNNTQEDVNKIEKKLKIILSAIMCFIIFSIIIMIIISFYLFTKSEIPKETRNNLEQPKAVGVIEVRGILNGVSTIYVMRYDENDRIIEISGGGGSSDIELNNISTDSDMFMFNSIDGSLLYRKFINHNIQEILDYIKKYYEYHGGTYEIINENDKDYIYAII